MNLDLTVEEINYILASLGKQPMEQVEGLVLRIRGQVISQQEKAKGDEKNV